MALIPITGIPSSYRVPGAYAEILFAQGPASAALGVRRITVVMPKTTAGNAVAATEYTIGNEQEAIDRAGAGSPAHRAMRIILRANKDAKLSYVGMDETTGGTPGKADGTVTITGTASGTGVLTVTIAGEESSVVVANGEAPTAIGDNIAAAINAKTHLPVTAANAAGVVTLTAKVFGTSQGDGTTGVIRFRSEITSGITTAVADSGAALGLGTGTAGVEGSTTEAAQLATALAALDSTRRYYIVTSTSIGATGLTNLVTHVTNKSEPNPGLRSVGITAHTGALATVQTLATGQNYERLQIAWQPNSEHDIAEIAGNVAAVRQKREGADSTFKFDSYRRSDWLIKKPFSVSDRPDGDDQNDAINDGITPIAADDSGSYIVMSVNTRSKDSGGTLDDFRATETHRVSGADEVVDQMIADYQLNFGEAKLKDDQLLSDGTVNPNQRLQRNVTTASTFKPWIRKELDDFEGATVLQNAAASKESLRVVRDPNNSGRLEVGLQLHVIDHLHQATFRVAEVSTG